MKSFLRNVLHFLVAAFMLVFGALFAVQNTETVALDLVFVQLPERSLALWVLAAFAAGGILGLAASSYLILRFRGLASAARRGRRAAEQ